MIVVMVWISEESAKTLLLLVMLILRWGDCTLHLLCLHLVKRTLWLCYYRVRENVLCSLHLLPKINHLLCVQRVPFRLHCLQMLPSQRLLRRFQCLLFHKHHRFLSEIIRINRISLFPDQIAAICRFRGACGIAVFIDWWLIVGCIYNLIGHFFRWNRPFVTIITISVYSWQLLVFFRFFRVNRR